MNSEQILKAHQVHLPVLLPVYALFITLLLLIPTVVYAKDNYDIEVEVSRTHIVEHDTITYKVVVAGKSASVPQPDIDIPRAFRILAGPYSSHNVQFVNGKLNAERTITYILQASFAGEFEIPAPEVKTKRKTYKGEAVKVVVSKDEGADDDEDPNASSSSRQSSQQNSSQRNRSRSDASIKVSGSPATIFLQAELNKESVYEHEPVIVSYYLYFRESVSTYNIDHLSTTEGFWTEELKVPQEPQINTRLVNGAEYRQALIYRRMLFPTKSGELEIGPMDITCEVREKTKRRQRSLFDDFFNDPFGYQSKSKEVSSEAVTVNVKALPSNGKPDSFNNIVGQYRIKAEVDRDSVKTNESVTLTVKINGDGNIGFLPEPKITFPPDIEKYDPQTNEYSKPYDENLRGYKTYKYLLIPRRAGEQLIPPIELSFFDPESKRYISKKTNPILLHVAQAEGWAAIAGDSPGGSAEEVRSLSKDIRYIHDATSGIRRIGNPVYKSAAYPLTYAAPLAIFLISWLLRRRHQKIIGDVSGLRSKKATKRALNSLKEANSAHSENKTAEGYEALARGILNYIADRTNSNIAELDFARVQELLVERKIENGKIDEVKSIIERCNMARFTPDGLDNIALGHLIDNSKNWIISVDRNF